MGTGLYIVTEDEGATVGIREGWNDGEWLRNTGRLDTARQASLLFTSINPPDILIFSPFLISRPRRANRGNVEETIVPFFCISAQKEVCATHLRRLPFAFSEQALQAAFLQFVYVPARKMRDCKGNIPLTLGFQ